MLDKKKSPYDRLNELVNIKLHEDPVAAGLDKINEIIANISNNSSEVTRFFNKVIDLLTNIKVQKDVKRRSIKIKIRGLLQTDEEVRKGKSKDERVFVAESKLAEDFKELGILEDKMTRALAFREVVENAQQELRMKKQQLGKQIDLIRQQIELGVLSGEWFRK